MTAAPVTAPVTATLTEPDLAALARALAAEAAPGWTILLDGPVGAGKTAFARAFVRARQGAAPEEVPSPTFTLVQTYVDTQGTEIWHADLYRLADPAEVEELGLTDALPGAIALIEWPDRLDPPPAGAIRLTLAPVPEAPDHRGITVAGGPPAAARAAARALFARGAGWGRAAATPLAGDASARRYWRLRDGATTAMLMDDPPPGSLPAYAAMTGWLRDRGFGAPALLAADPPQGFALVEDLGDDLLARVLDRDPALAPAAYAAVTDLLVALGRHAPPPGLTRLDPPTLAAMVAPFTDEIAAIPALPGAIADLATATGAGTAGVLSLRDCHAENLIWRGPGQPLGLLDFQDAVVAHPAYDLVSALQDARRDVDPALEDAMIARFCAATGAPEASFRAAYALLGAQRGLRILGIFARLQRQGKPRYRAFVPRVRAAVARNLTHPALAPLARALERAL